MLYQLSYVRAVAQGSRFRLVVEPKTTAGGVG
jgi:hypothetical protein